MRVAMTEFRRRILFGAVLMTVALLSGCLVGPHYQRPAVSTPANFRGQDAATSDSIADLPWWNLFADQTLQSLIHTAVVNNHDLRAAAARVEQARELAAESHAQYLPQIGYEAGLSEGKNESLGTAASSSGVSRGTVVGLLQASWEADVWDASGGLTSMRWPSTWARSRGGGACCSPW